MSTATAFSWRSAFRIADRGEYVLVNDVPVAKPVYQHLASWLDRVQASYEEEVIRKACAILSKSLSELWAHRVEDFYPYGEYRVFETAVAQLRREYRSRLFEPRPHLVVLYGSPGTGKTTWVRHVAKKFLVENGVLGGVYLEASPGDFLSKWAGVPINTARSVIECAKTRNLMSVVLLDEADGLFTRPGEAMDGVTLEQIQLVAEMKSQLSFITSQSYPTMIVLTTNYRDAIVRSDPALADRVTSWIYVPPPPTEVRERMVGRLLARMFRDIWSILDPLGQVTILRVLTLGGVAPLIGERGDFRFTWRLPVLPYEADYVVAYLSAWGWSPLDRGVLPVYDVDFLQAIQLWREDNPVVKVYAKGLTTLIELARVASSEFHRAEKSFLRTLAVAKRGVEDFKRLYADVYVEGYENAVYAYLWSERGELGYAEEHLERLRELGMQVQGSDTKSRAAWVYRRYANDLRETLFTHPAPPILLHQALLKEFEVPGLRFVVNDIHSMIYFIVAGLRYAFLPLVYTSATNIFATTAEFRRKVELYSRFVKRELLEGELLKPLRIMYTESDTEKAWAEAVKALNELGDEDTEEVRTGIALALVPLKLLHPAIHTRDVEEKARYLYNTFRNRATVKEVLWQTATELNVHLDIYPIFEHFPIPGMYVWPDVAYVKEASLIHPFIFDNFKSNSYNPAYALNDLGAIAVGVKLRSKELVEKMGLKLD